MKSIFLTQKYIGYETKIRFFPSVVVALLAGFIYYQLGGVEDIKKLPGYAYNLFSYIVKLDIPNQVSINADIALKDKNSAPECASEVDS